MTLYKHKSHKENKSQILLSCSAANLSNCPKFLNPVENSPPLHSPAISHDPLMHFS